MKKFQFIGIAIMMLCINSNWVFAQQQQETAYQKKIIEITQKYFKILYGYDKQFTVSEKLQLNMMTNSEEASSFILGLGILGYAANHTETETKRLVTQIGNEMKQAEKLKTSVDFKRVKDAKDKKGREENEKKLREQRDAYERTDIGSLKRDIKSAFEEWNNKGEFEKEAEYQERLKTKSEDTFNQYCVEQIKNKIDKFDLEYDLKRELSVYNTDNESFTISFKINDLEWKNQINIPISKAEEFKNRWYDLERKIEYCDWCIVDSRFCPTLITVVNPTDNAKYKFLLSLTNQTEISIPFDELEISNPFLKNKVFHYSEVKRIVEKQLENQFIEEQKQLLEKQRIDSIEYDKYCQKLKSVFEEYNLKLLQNPHNESRKIMTIYSKMVMLNGNWDQQFNYCKDAIRTEYNNINVDIDYNYYCREIDSTIYKYNFQLLSNPYNVYNDTLSNKINISRNGDLKYSFDYCIKTLKSNFEELNNNLERKMEYQNPSKYCQIFYKLNTNKKTEADKMFLECSCKYSERLKFDIDFIKGKLNECNCRAIAFGESSTLFRSKSEFDSIYNMGDKYFKEEISVREFKTLASKLESINFSIVNKKESPAGQAGKDLLYDITGIDIQDNTEKSEAAKYFLQRIDSYRNLNSYSRIIDFTIETNKGLNKEWAKKGGLFANKVEFYESYLSGNYKQILKDKKK